MDAPLQSELGDGEKAAWLLVRHVDRMGSTATKIPVTYEGRDYLVTVASQELTDEDEVLPPHFSD
jgi:hypothetical protein